MKQKFKVAIKTIALAVVVDVISSVIYSKINNVDFVSSFLAILQHIINFCVSILNYKISLWIILLIIFMYALTIRLLNNLKGTRYTPEYMNYLTDKYNGINYEWKLSRYGNEISMERLIPICECGSNLTTRSNYKNRYYCEPKLYCVNCDKIIEEKFDGAELEDARLYFHNKLNKMIKNENKKIKDK